MNVYKSEHERITALEGQMSYFTDQMNVIRQSLTQIDAEIAAILKESPLREQDSVRLAGGNPINVPIPKSLFTGRGCKKKRIWTRQPDRAGKEAQVTVTICNDTTREMDIITSDGQKAGLEAWEKATPEGRPPVIIPDCHTFVGDIRWVEIHFKGIETERGSGTFEGTITWF